MESALSARPNFRIAQIGPSVHRLPDRLHLELIQPVLDILFLGRHQVFPVVDALAEQLWVLSGLGAALAIAAQHLPKLLEHHILVIQVLIQGEQAGVGVQQVGVEPEGLRVGRDRLGGADAVGKRDVRDRFVPEGPWRVAHALGRAGEEPQVDLAQNEVGAGVVGVGANRPPRRPQRQVEEADGTVVVPRLEVGSAPEKELVRRRRLGVLRQHGWAGQNVPRKGHRGRREDRSVGAGRRADDAGGQRRCQAEMVR